MAERNPPRSFDDDARQATETALPIPRGIAFRLVPPDGKRATVTAARRATAGVLPGWQVTPVEGLSGWYTATPSVPPPLGQFWEQLRALQAVDGVAEAEPLLLVASQDPESEADAPFAMGYGPDQFGLWGWPYDAETARTIARIGAAKHWHLDQLNVRGDDGAWAFWLRKHPGKVPGAGILIGHPDTGYTDHDELAGRFQLPGKSFLSDDTDLDGRDDLRKTGLRVMQHPGHGTGTASVIASAEAGEAFGVAPGARVLPLRVSRSVIHFDFENVGKAILHAVGQGADVISMSLGGPLKMGFVHECIREAQRNGVIIVSAAGNMIPSTIFPAAFPEVIAAAATHAGRAPWRYSGLGHYVDIAAPGEGVWRAMATPGARSIRFDVTQGTGTSFATACVAGLAALWLSYHGGRKALARDSYGGNLALVPLAFQYLLAKTADTSPEFVRNGRHGAGIANARALLAAPLPDIAEVERFRSVIQAQKARRTTFLSGLLTGWRGITDESAVSLSIEATVADDGSVRVDPVEDTAAVMRAGQESDFETQLLERLLGPQVDELVEELAARVSAELALLIGFHRLRPGESLLPLFDRLLRVDDPSRGQVISPALRTWLEQQKAVEERRQQPLHRGRLTPSAPLAAVDDSLPPPRFRRLRAYAFDPTLDTSLANAPITQVTVPTRWEEVQPGPVGEYLEIIDIDPASGCVYAPVDLNHPHILAQDGLAPSEGDPRFHQQMVYAVAMNTIHRFELALGRPIFWSPIRPRPNERLAEVDYYTPEARGLIEKRRGQQPRLPPWRLAERDRYVQRLRIYPHALREANAYYSPRKRALLFGYFPATDTDTGRHYPGGMVFTCLSHDIIAHEMTHALLDGMHPHFNEPTNADVWAFHEAFADIMALFQHFTYPEVLRHQIAATRGDLETESLLGELAQQLGQATGGHGALRSALGAPDAAGRWERHRPDPRALQSARAPHQRGTILVAAVFDAYIAIYRERVADLLRIYSGGTGVLHAGRIHPDLVNRLASEAAQAAEDVLHTCIRAMDYVPPVDITFGEFLRALITADYDLSPQERRSHRIAFIEAFRAWGIYPRDVATLSEDSLRWHPPAPDAHLRNLLDDEVEFSGSLRRLVSALEGWQPGSNRGQVFLDILEAQSVLHRLLKTRQARLQPGELLLPGLDLRDGAAFSVGNLRPARRIGLHGEFRTELVVEIVQQYSGGGGAFPFRGGCTLVVDMQSGQVRYIIYKRLYERLPQEPGGLDGEPASRHFRQQQFVQQQRSGGAGTAQALWQGEADGALVDWLADTYASGGPTRAAAGEPFALMHRSVE